MELRALGNTKLMVSPIGLGTVRLGRTRGLKYPVPGAGRFSLPSDENVTELLRTAADLHVNLIDTAPAYGSSEERIGELMAANGWLGGRDRWVVCTKVGEEFDDTVGESRFDFTPEHVKRSVERSLRRLRIDTLDVVLAHSDGRDEWIIESSGAMEALRELRHRGLVRAIGVSTKTVDGGLLAVRASGGGCDVVMVEYGPATRAEGVVIDSARLRGVGVLVKKGLGSGHAGALMSRMPAEIRSETSDPVEAAMRFVLGRAGVSSMVVGTTNVEHLRANVAAARPALG